MDQQLPDVTPAAQPPVAAPPFTLRDLLKDTLARYAAGFWPIFLASVVLTVANVALSLTYVSRVVATRTPDLFADVLVFAIAMVGGAVLISIAGASPDGPLAAAVWRGVRRSPRFFLVMIAIGFGFGVVGVIAGIIGVVLFDGSPVIAVLVVVAIVLALGWGLARLYLASPAVVVDEIGASDSLRLAWSVTKPRRTWIRMLGAVILMYVVIVPATAVPGLLAITTNPSIPLLVANTVLAGLVAPVTSVFLVAAYRRLVPGNAREWLAGAPPTPFAAPSFGRAARMVLLALLVAGAIGFIQLPGAFQSYLRLMPTFPTYPSYPSTLSQADQHLG